jgi:hypothetical protein
LWTGMMRAGCEFPPKADGVGSRGLMGSGVQFKTG